MCAAVNVYCQRFDFRFNKIVFHKKIFPPPFCQMFSKIFVAAIAAVCSVSSAHKMEISVSRPDLDLCGTCTQLDGYVFISL